MSTLLWTSPRSSPGPAPMHTRPSHQVHFGASAHPQPHHHANNGFENGNPSNTTFVSIADGSNEGMPSSLASFGRLGFGFGAFQPSSQQQQTSLQSGFGAPSAYHSSTFFGGSSSASTSAAGSTPNSPPKKRRQRSASMGEGDHADDYNNDRRERSGINADDSNEEGFAKPFTAGREIAGGKRARRDFSLILRDATAATAANASGVQPQASFGSTASSNDIDLGKALASLSKPALLSLVTNLIAQQPELKPAVAAMLPPPSLEAFVAHLAILERRVLDALPVGRGLRDEYVWSRIRAPLEEYISEARMALSQFCPTTFNPAPMTASPVATSGTGGEQPLNPTTIFSFLYTLTLSVRKLECSLPRAPVAFRRNDSQAQQPSINNPSTLNPRDPLMSFLPPLFNQWHTLATRLSTTVNSSGRMLSADLVRTWFRNLDELVNVSPPVAAASEQTRSLFTLTAPDIPPYPEGTNAMVGRRACEGVRERFVKELGWLIGVRNAPQPEMPTPSPSLRQTLQNVSVVGDRISGHQQQHQLVAENDFQEARAIANQQQMDSRMMLGDEDVASVRVDDDEDEEL